jgi:hypothetical protein
MSIDKYTNFIKSTTGKTHMRSDERIIPTTAPGVIPDSRLRLMGAGMTSEEQQSAMESMNAQTAKQFRKIYRSF